MRRHGIAIAAAAILATAGAIGLAQTGGAAPTAPIPQPNPVGVLTRAVLDFRETPGSGTYTAQVTLPQGAWLMGLLAQESSAWSADSLSFDLGTATEPTSYVDDSSLSQIDPRNDPNTTSPYGAAIDYLFDGVQPDAYELAFQYTSPFKGAGEPIDAPTTITARLATMGAGGSNGRLRVLVLGFGVPTATVIAGKS